MPRQNLTQAQQVAVIAEVVERIESAQETSAKRAEVMAKDIIDLHTKADDLVRRMSAVEPVTQMVTGWHARMVGMAIILGFMGSVATAGWLLLKERLWTAWQALWGG